MASSIPLVHGFRVLVHGNVSPGFTKALKTIRTGGFADASCTIVKTSLGKLSGLTHEGGRYVHPKNPLARQVTEMMRDQGIEPPPMPFVLAPGPFILFHEWGHHVDRVWSREDGDVTFSFRWFSHFYQVGYRRLPNPWSGTRRDSIPGPIEVEDQAIDAVPQWQIVASELFADLFEDWMRGTKKRSWDVCDPHCLDYRSTDHACLIRLDLLPGMSTNAVRQRTHDLFESGLRPEPDRPVVREDLLGPYTATVVERLRQAMRRIRLGNA